MPGDRADRKNIETRFIAPPALPDLSALNLHSLAHAHGEPLGRGIIRSRPEDFIVRECLGFEPSGHGEHLLLIVRKRGANTKWVAKQIASHAGARVRDIGYAGLKDRHAITEQAFTLLARGTTPESWLDFKGEGFAVIGAHRQLRKLRRGAHKANDFEITVRNVQVDPEHLRVRLHAIAQFGVPNYFGAQRFGRDGNNLRIADKWFTYGEVPADRDARGFALSASRSALFNAVLSRRVADGSWNCLLPGEVVNLDGSGSVFACEQPDEVLQARCAQLDVHPTGPLVGCGESRVIDAARAIEEQVLTPWQRWSTALAELKVEAHRRALRLAVSNLTWEYAGDTLSLRFRLNRGAFATAVLRELIVTTQALDDGQDHD